ncbi:hypothetical protein D3C85_1231420 [compost metagenome]
MLFISVLFLFSNCKKKEEPAQVPSASDAVFSHSVDKNNPNIINFKYDGKMPVWYVHWDMGSGAFAEGANTSKFFIKKGVYKVRMKIFTTGGTAESTQEVTIEEDFKGENLLQGGEMKPGDAASWTILDIGSGVNWTFNNGSVTATGGNFGHQGIYQAINVEAGKTYKFDARVFGSGANDSWFELYINEKAPVAGQDYSGVPVLLGLNTWSGCGKSAFDDKLSVLSCNGSNNEIQFNKSGTVYFVIKTGGSSLGTTGISLTDVEFYAIN